MLALRNDKLFDAIIRHDAAAVKQLLCKTNARVIRQEASSGIDALMLAAIHSQPFILHLLLAAGGNPRQRATALYKQYQAIDFACLSGCPATTLALLSSPDCRLPETSRRFSNAINYTLRCCSHPLWVHKEKTVLFGPEALRVCVVRLSRYRWPMYALSPLYKLATWSVSNHIHYSRFARAAIFTIVCANNRITIKLPTELLWYVFQRIDWFVPHLSSLCH